MAAKLVMCIHPQGAVRQVLLHEVGLQGSGVVAAQVDVFEAGEGRLCLQDGEQLVVILPLPLLMQAGEQGGLAHRRIDMRQDVVFIQPAVCGGAVAPVGALFGELGKVLAARWWVGKDGVGSLAFEQGG